MCANDPSFVVIGGGIAGISAVEQMMLEDPDLHVTLITASNVVKTVSNFKKLSKNCLEEFDVSECEFSVYAKKHRHLTVIKGIVVDFNPVEKFVELDSDDRIYYRKLCICCGANPKMMGDKNAHVLTIRDTQSVDELQEKLKSARRVAVIGNGGISTEFVYEISNCDIIWAVRDSSIGSTFFDCGAAQFFLPHLESDQKEQPSAVKRRKYTCDLKEPLDITDASATLCGSALGPDWSSHISLKGLIKDPKTVHIEYGCEVSRILSADQFQLESLEETNFENLSTSDQGCWPVYAELTNGVIVGCDFILSATGVVPNTTVFSKYLEMSVEEAIVVDEHMMTSCTDVFAAGDVCSAGWTHSKHWHQMRLWTQARQMGSFAGRCMLADHNEILNEILQDFCFEMFTHVTKFFGFKVVLLGLFNGHKLTKDDYEVWLRVSKGREYVKTVMDKEGRMQGAILIGETDLEETFENLILDQLDLSSYKEDLLDPGVDIEDYFD